MCCTSNKEQNLCQFQLLQRTCKLFPLHLISKLCSPRIRMPYFDFLRTEPDPSTGQTTRRVCEILTPFTLPPFHPSALQPSTFNLQQLQTSSRQLVWLGCRRLNCRPLACDRFSREKKISLYFGINSHIFRDIKIT